MQLNRRKFIIGSIAIATLPVPAIAVPARDPFVEVGDGVSFLYFEDWTRPFQPNGPLDVEAVGAWNGDHYPISLRRFDHGNVVYFDAIDSEWVMFRKEVPEFSWADHSDGRYPNIHAYVREKRFGEDPRAMAFQMEMNRIERPRPGVRPCVPARATVWP